MEFCTLEIFLKNTRYKVKKNDEIHERNGIHHVIVATNHVDVTKIWYEDFNSKNVVLAVDFCSPDGTIHDSITVRYTNMGHRISAHWDSLFKILKPDIKKSYYTRIFRIYQKYFCYCVNQYIAFTPAVLSACGWLPEARKSVFLSINDTYPQNEILAADFFNGMKKGNIFKQELSAEWYRDFFELLSNPSILTIFAYSVHSVLWNYLHGYVMKHFENSDLNTDTICFSLCIHGENPELLRVVANLFSNFFLIKGNNWTLIDKKYHISATSLSDERYKKLFKYRCVPIIFSTERGYFTRASSMLKKVQKERNKGYWHIYPVYINPVPIRADEVLNCCIDSVQSIIPLKDKDKLHRIHLDFCLLIYKFIKYLTEISDLEDLSKGPKYIEMENDLWATCEREDLSAEWIDSHTPEVLLYSTMVSFTRFLKQSPLSVYAEYLSHTCITVFLPYKECNSVPDITNVPDTFLQDFRSFLQQSIAIKANNSWIFEGVETRGGEKCYYFYPNEGYEHYVHFAKKNHLPILSKQKLGQKLRKSNVLKTTGSSNRVKRTQRKIYVYAIKQTSLENF